MDAEEVRSAALGHAVAAYGHVAPGQPIGAQQQNVVSLAILFATYIAEGGAEALRMLGVETADPALVVRLVPVDAHTP